MTAEEIVARLVYRDGLMLVIDKPAGLAVHKGPKGGESLEDYFDALRFGLPRPPIASTAIPPAAWCSAAIARRWRRSVACSRAGGSARAIGRWSQAGRRRRRAASSCRSAERMTRVAGGRSTIPPDG